MLARRILRAVLVSLPYCFKDGPFESSRYPAFSAPNFHGCRPENIRSYYEHGLQGQLVDRIHARFLELFHDVAALEIQKAIDYLQTEAQARKTKFG